MQALRRGVFGVWWWFALVCVLAAPVRAQVVVVTLLDGEAALVDGTRRVAAAPGVRVSPGALIETTAASAVLRLESSDRSIVDLGPGTRAMLLPPAFAARSGKAPLLYLLAGWAKVTSPDKEAAGGIVTPAIELMPFTGAAVVASGKEGVSLFAESGPLEAAERGSARRHALKTGALFSGGTVEARPSATWLARVPRAFRDPLPRRGAQYAEKPVAGSPLPGPSYAQLADWLAAEPAVRRDFPRRFEALAQDAAFRRELQQHLPAHPEWARVLNPPETKKP